MCVCWYVCHRGHYEGLSRCRLVGSCVLPGEDFFTQAYMYNHVCTFDTVTGNLAVISRFHHFQINER